MRLAIAKFEFFFFSDKSRFFQKNDHLAFRFSKKVGAKQYCHKKADALLMARLISVGGAINGLPTIDLTEGSHTIGREAMVVLPALPKFPALLSRQHATLELAGPASASGLCTVQATLIDGVRGKPSLNGVFVNGERVSEMVLNDGDELVFGVPGITAHPIGSKLGHAKLIDIPYRYRFQLASSSGRTNRVVSDFFAVVPYFFQLI